MEKERYQTLQCCNPLKKLNHSMKDRKRLRNVPKWMCDMFPDIPKMSKICDNCRKQIGLIKNQGKNDCSPDDDKEPSYSPGPSAVLETLNMSLQELGESPVRSTNLQIKQYSTKKLKNIEFALKKKLFTNAEDSSENEEFEQSVLSNLKTSFSNLTNRQKKVMLLTCLPESWSIRKIMREFNAPNYMVRQAKWLLKERGILESPDQKPGKYLSEEVVKTVHSFYENDDISRVMPGKKDYVTVKVDNGDKTVISKRLILCNLKEMYKNFKDKFPEMKIGFSKFAELRPKHCILAGHSGTHSVCVCTTHQNVKLMIENAKLSALTSGELASYKHCLAKVLCNPASIPCIMGNCSSCPGNECIKNMIQNAFDNNMVDNITFRQWISVDRCNLETILKSSSEFIELFSEKLTALIFHDFLAKQQSSFINEVKENLNEGDYVVTCDFSENYTFVVQDEAQSYHWTSDYATVHPFVVYYKGVQKTEHISYVIISDCLEHNTLAVYCFQKKLIKFLKTKFQNIQKLYYFSDGSAAQYKNKKNFVNLCFHKVDFSVEAEWHFFASAHGKGPCDGVGGTVKRLATKASLQRVYDGHILTPQQLFDWAVKNIKSIYFDFSTQEEYIETETFLEERFSQSVTVKGTQKLHAFIPINTSKILVKTFSDATEFSIETVTKSPEKLTLGEIHGYITVIYDKQWWLAYILTKDECVDEVKVSFLHPAGPSLSYRYPMKPDILWISVNDVLYKVNPVTPTGRIYQIPENEAAKINEAFQKLLK